MYEYFAIWSIWPLLPHFYKLYWLLLTLAGLYSLFSALSIDRRLRILRRRDDYEKSSLIGLEAGIMNLRQIIATIFFTFGTIFFSALPGAFETFGLSRSTLLGQITGALSVNFAFAANVFFVLLFLHCVQWFVSRRVVSMK